MGGGGGFGGDGDGDGDGDGELEPSARRGGYDGGKTKQCARGGGHAAGQPKQFPRGGDHAAGQAKQLPRGGGDEGSGQAKQIARGGDHAAGQAKQLTRGGQTKQIVRGGDRPAGQPKQLARAAAPPKQFANVRYKLMGFRADEESRYKRAMESRGATESRFYGPKSDCTHLIVYAYLVTEGIYKPAVPGGIPGGLSLSICCSGYRPDEKEDIKLMVYLMGGSFYEEWTHLISHAICFESKGITYEKAKDNGSKVVNKYWLQDCLNTWTILPCDNYSITNEKVDILEENTQILHQSSIVSTDKSVTSVGFQTPKERSVSQSLDSKSTDNKRPRTENNNSTKPTCIRSLQYNPKRSVPIDKYVEPEDRVISVQYPFERRPQELTEPTLKRILLKAYVPVAHFHNDNRSLGGRLGCNNYLISEPNETVHLCDVTIVELTPKNRKADKEGFVNMVESLFQDGIPPADVRVWLQSITEGWEDALVLNHINMGDTEFTFGHFLTMYYCLKTLEKNNKKEYTNFLGRMHRYKDWYEEGFKWTVLDGNKDYKLRLPEQNSSEKRVDHRQFKKKVDPHRLNAHGAIKTIKNTWSHPAQGLQEYFLAILLRESEDLLSTFQKAIFDSKFYGKKLSVKQFI
ncbi:hypothetical protein ACQ4PT_007089 [Festuca glaucescens]